MTVTVVYADPGDGYLRSSSIYYATARPGGTITTFSGPTTGIVGQTVAGGSFSLYQAFVRFSYPAVGSANVVTSAAIRVKLASILSPSVSRELELRAYTWSGSGLTSADWRDGSTVGSLAQLSRFATVNAASSTAQSWAGSDALRASVGAGTTVEVVAFTDRFRAGNIPTVDETLSFHLASASGTVNDPALIFTTTPRGSLHAVLGAAAQLSDETWAYLENDGSSIQLRHRDAAGTVTTIGTGLPIGTTSATFGESAGAQGFALVADGADNLYVVGRSGSSGNAVAARGYAKGAGYSWTPQAVLSTGLPYHTSEVNNLAATWHPGVAGGSVMVLAAHTSGFIAGAGTVDTAWATFSSATLLGGSGAVPVGMASAAVLSDTSAASGAYGGHRNEVGSGLDLASFPDNPTWGVASSFEREQMPGDNVALPMARYVLSGDGTGFAFTSLGDELGYGRKDATGKIRVVPLTGGLAAQVTADADPGYGLTVSIRQHSGTEAGSVGLGRVYLAAESIPTMPDGPAIASSLAWDAVHVATTNELWIYYVSTSNPLQVLRTSINLSTYQATRTVVTVATMSAGRTVQAIRVPRNARVWNRTLVQIDWTDGTNTGLVSQVDSFPVAPTAPTLTPRDGFDATGTAVFSWTFSDPNPGDTQSAYRLQVEDVSDNSLDLDTGKAVSGTQSYTSAANALVNGKSYRWRVMTWDSADLASPWSGYGTFSTAAGGTVTITSPSVDNPPGLATDEVEIRWTATGTTQAAYRVWAYLGAAMVSDTGWITSTATNRLVSGLQSDREYEIRVQVRNASLVTSSTATRRVTPSYGTPEKPSITVTPYPEDGYVLVSVSNPLPGEPATGYPEEDFEAAGYSFGAWFLSSVTAVQSTEQAHKGTNSMKMTSTGTPTQAYARAPAVAVVPGQRYTVRFWAYRPTAGSVTAAIDWSTGSSYISTNASLVTLAAGTWTLVTVSGTAPPTAAQASYGPTLSNNPPTGTVVYVDELILTGASDRPDVSRNDILRRPSGSADWEVIGSCEPDGTFRDYTFSSKVSYEYVARGVV